MDLIQESNRDPAAITLEVVTQTLRAYLEDRAIRIGPEFDGWVAYHFDTIRRRLSSGRKPLRYVIAYWGKDYGESRMTADDRARDRQFEWNGRRRPKFVPGS